MDAKARPNNTFSASVNGRTSSFNSNSLETSEQLLEVQVNSNINYTRRLSKINSSFQISARHNQNFANNSISITLPELSFNASRFTPFQKKIQTEKKAFYEKIGFVYTARTKATITTIDSLLLSKQSLDDIQFGVSQSATVDMPVNLFKYFVFRPSFTYNERWYIKEESRFLDSNNDLQRVQSNGFFGVRDFNVNAALSTTVTGIYNFKTKRLKAIRHIVKPTVNYTFRPDFGAEKWGYYDSYIDPDNGRVIEYSKYQFLNNLYGTPGQGLQNLFTINIRNNFEMKVVDKKDSLGGLKKIPLLEQFNVATGYDFTADSLRMRPLVFSAQSSLFKNLISWNVGATLDPYALNQKRVKISETHFSVNKRLLRFDNAFASLQLNLSGKSKSSGDEVPQFGTLEERQFIADNPDMFFDFNVPWSLSLGYRMNITKGVAGNLDSTVVTANTITFGGHINVTPKWQINLSSGFDIRNQEITLTNVRVERDLHCWVLAFNWTAFPLNRQTYAIDLHVKSPILQELKLSRKQPPGTVSSVF